MRLLNVYTRQLEEFFSTNIPKYAILSHTWGDEEVLFQDLSNPIYKTKKGYRKIKGCCQRAILDRLKFVWIDTCCIDKSSSAELSESINSMYAWYEGAIVCYVYLTDVPPGEDPGRSDSAFRKSRWFTRGWTLQELLAPRRVAFFDRRWNLVCNFAVNYVGEWVEVPVVNVHRYKQLNHVSLLEDITGIENFYLRYREKIRDAPAGLKFSWAAMRETSRQEDLAYCLLGLLQVNMPLLYGEGDNAFRRLQEEVLKRRQDLSILAWGLNITWREIAEQSGFDRSRLYGTLASSIRNYKEFHKYFTSRLRFFEPTTHSMITNLGLNIKLPLLCIDSSLGIYLAFISDWEGAEALVLPLLKRDEGGDSQLFEHLPGSPHVISIILQKGAIGRNIQLKTIYLVESRAVFPVWNRTKFGYILSENRRPRTQIRIDHEQMDEAGFEVSSFFPPAVHARDQNFGWETLPGYFEIIMIFSRALSDYCVARVQGYSVGTDIPRLQMSIARCEPSSLAWQYVNNSRSRNPFARVERPWMAKKLEWKSKVSFEPIQGKALERTSIELKMDDAWYHASLKFYAGTED
ncbi:c4a4f13b-e1d9-4f9f-8c10-a2841501f0a2-CDS [Sclerotinia trifoliorum]|uniref:C4a4f13b-e1d9-4f9f-8c10-a2841501f0a2-CDS n=1 Tax=Sclerotinia trifoliorum TaxID=28548 RepID=A0A8H2W3K9_9HELO|nr:c4a4f13b-e1d9-4f9f-8c10-a2841501f0a2-CDS [Sclerotinia trifoliorum]